MPGEDYYEILQVHPKASPEVIKKAYKVLAVKYHPDKYPSSKKKWAEAKFRTVGEAYDILSDNVSRAEYDVYRSTTDFEHAISPGQDIEYEREAFFHLRSGMEHYERAIKGGLLNSLLGGWQSNLNRCRAHLLKVISTLPDATLIEDARFFNFRALTRISDYSSDHQESVKEEFELFLSDFSSSRLIPHVKLEMADFFVAKCLDFEQAKQLLEEIVNETENEEMARTCYARLAYIEMESIHHCGNCGRKLFGSKRYCRRCRHMENLDEDVGVPGPVGADPEGGNG